MPDLNQLFSADTYIQWVEVVTIAAILVVLLYIFYSLKIFNK